MTQKLAFVAQLEYGIYKLYFTDEDISDLYGDDWDDRPYEHNASEPYGIKSDRNKEVTFETYILESDRVRTPCSGYLNSPWSVDDILAKKVPWLEIVTYTAEGEYNLAVFHAGAAKDDIFKSLAEDDPYHELYKKVE